MRWLKAIFPAALAISAIACAPQESLNPLCTSQEAVVDMALVGDWQEKGGASLLEIHGKWQAASSTDSDGSDNPSPNVPPDSKTYSILYVEGKNKKLSSFEGRLIRLRDDFFLDIAPTEAPVDADFKYFPVSRTEDGDPPQYTKLSELFYMALTPSQPDAAGAAQGDSYDLQILAAHAFLKVRFEDDDLRVAWLDREWMQEMVNQGRVSIDHTQAGDTLLLTASSEALQDLVQQFSNDPQAFKEIGEWRRKR
jgi:hypothetical protein